jgi:hypothetical protein
VNLCEASVAERSVLNPGCSSASKTFLFYNAVTYSLKTRTVEPEKQPLLGNSRTQQCNNRGSVTVRDVRRTAVAMERLDKHVRCNVTQQ